MANRTCTWTGAVNASWFNTGNWLGLDGGSWPGDCGGSYPSCPNNDTVYFLGASAQRKMVPAQPPMDPVLLVAVYADAAYGALNGDFGYYGDPGFEVPGGTIRWYGEGGVTVTMYGMGYPSVVELYDGAYINSENWHADVGVFVYDSPKYEFPPNAWMGVKVFLMRDDIHVIEGPSALWVEPDVEDWMDGLLPGEGNVRHGTVFGKGDSKTGTLVVPRRSC